MFTTSDFKRGLVIQLEGAPYLETGVRVKVDTREGRFISRA